MITFRHGVTNFKNMTLECCGISSPKASAAAAALMAAAIKAIELRHPSRYDKQQKDGYVRVRCEYNQHTAEIANTVICGFMWLSEQLPDSVQVERISERMMNNAKTP